tara:strand:+ start:464 stop:1255 length:792 start_codon:yes stop_codon:yes gene_type:complete
MSQDILLDVEDRVATVTLNRPDKMNAFTVGMVDQWAAALEECAARDDVAVIVVTGAGKAFCSGGDIDLLMRARSGARPLDRKNELAEHVHRIPLLLERMDKPVIAAMNGAAAGAGLDLALMCDIRFAAQSAKFAETYTKVGLVPGAGGAWILPRIVGTAKALELFWSADFIDAAEAERIGLINKVLPDGDLLDHTYAFARRVADGPQLAVRVIKRAVYQGQRMELRPALDMISSHYAIVTDSDDHKEAVAAYLEKRKPQFGKG